MSQRMPPDQTWADFPTRGPVTLDLAEPGQKTRNGDTGAEDILRNSEGEDEIAEDMSYGTYTYNDADSQKTSPSTESTGGGSFSDVGIEMGHPLSRWVSPPPTDEIVAQRKNESRYRLNLRHEFHPSCKQHATLLRLLSMLFQ